MLAHLVPPIHINCAHSPAIALAETLRYLFHAYPSRVTQIMDELPMCVLAYCYLRCTKGRCSYTDGKCWKPLHKSYVGLLLCAFSVYLFLPVYDIFTDLFTVLLVVPGVLCGVIAKEDPRVGRNCLCLSLVALLMAKVSSLNASEGILDSSVMIYQVIEVSYYKATGTIGDQRHA